MTDAALNSKPPFRTVLLEQLRTVSRSLRREAMLAAALAAVLTVVILQDVLPDGDAIDFQPDGLLLVALIGLTLPFAVWRHDRLYDGGYLWTLPVDRRRHALAKILSGLVLLGAVIAAFFAWLFALSMISGGSVGADETRFLINGDPSTVLRPVPSEGETRYLPTPGAPDALTPFRWRTPVWAWFTPVTAGLAAYLIGTAWMIGLRRPLLTALACVLGLVATLFVSEELLETGFIETFLAPLLSGPYGLGAALGGVGESVPIHIRQPEGGFSQAWTEPPSSARWAAAAAVWILAGLVGLWAALRRHREA
jgi:hypothetical protein